MFFFGKEKKKVEALKEAEIAEIHAETMRKAEKAKHEIEKVNKLLQENKGGIAELIYYATGGYRRDK